MIMNTVNRTFSRTTHVPEKIGEKEIKEEREKLKYGIFHLQSIITNRIAISFILQQMIIQKSVRSHSPSSCIQMEPSAQLTFNCC